MNELSKYLVEQILLEDENLIKKTIVTYVGRFQPFHKGHYATYQHLVKKFGKDNVFIGTSNKVEKPKSPFNFKEKEKIMNTMFGIPKSKIYQIKNPYRPVEILQNFDEETTAFITVVGEKDKSRLGGKYFTPFKGKVDEPYRDKGYVYASPTQSLISGTDVRNGLSLGSDEQKQSFFTDRAYPKFNKTIFKLITDKLNESVYIPKEIIEEWLIKEGTRNAPGQADDGPNSYFPNFETYSRVNINRAAKIGYEVINMIMSKELEDYYEHPRYPKGPVRAVTPFPAGVIGKTTATNQVDIYSNDAYSKWFKHVTRKASLVGYELIQTALSKQDDKEEKRQSSKDATNLKNIKETFEKELNEVITIPVEIGDTVLMGKFKNKKVVVKSIGKDEYGMPTINGKKVATFRLVQEGKEVIFEDDNKGSANTIAGTSVRCEKCNHSWEIEVNDIHPYLCHKCGWDSQQQEYDFDEFDSWREKMGLLEMSKSTLDRIEKFAEKQLSPEDIEFTKHFFDRVNDPRNGKEISDAELTGFFKRLSRFKKKFKEFLEKYQQIVVKDKRSDINIPFVKQANQIIAKTVMRKDDFKTSNPILSFESLNEGMYDPKNIKAYYEALCKAEGDAYVGKRDQLAKFKKLENHLIDKYVYSKYSKLLYENKNKEDTVKYISKSLGVPRSKMPQINSKDVADFVKYLKDKGISVSASNINVSKIGMTQKDLNVDKIKGLMGVNKSNLSKPVIISKDNYILDGHHRVASLYNLDNNFKLKTIKVDLGINDLLKVAKDYPKTTFKSVNELAPHGYPNQEWMDNHDKEMKKLRTQLDKQHKKVYNEGIEDTLSNKYKVDLDVYEYPTHLELRRIVVPQDKRGQGLGSKVMGDLIKYAQSNKKDLFTTPDSSFGGSKPRLVQFYKSFGFKDNKGSNRDFRSKETMVLLVRK